LSPEWSHVYVFIDIPADQFSALYRNVATQCVLFYINWTVARDEIAIAVGFVILVYEIDCDRLAT
jgi:hypothetical protein